MCKLKRTSLASLSENHSQLALPFVRIVKGFVSFSSKLVFKAILKIIINLSTRPVQKVCGQRFNMISMIR